VNINFKNKTILITGASSGIGLTLYKRFKKLGGQVIGTQKSKKIKDLIYVDLSSEEALKNFFLKIKKIKKIDILINNAGSNIINDITSNRDQDIDEIISTNLIAPLKIIREVAKKMKKNKYGRIVNISSIFGHISKKKRSLYSSTKFGINGITKASALDLAEYNILVNSVSPGFVLTSLTKKILGKEIKKIESKIPIKRIANTDEIVNLVLFLSSNYNSYITGENIIIDGGFTTQ